MDVVFLGINDVGMRIYEWLCDRQNVSVLSLVTTKEQLELVEQLQPDLVVSVGYDHLVPDSILSIPSKGCLNMHPGYLPHNRGKSGNVWPLVEGTPAGVTLHYMDAEFDTGEIIAQRTVETDFTDTGKTLHRRMERAQFELFTEVWPDIVDGSIEATPQSAAAGSYHSIDDFRSLCEIDPEATYEAKELLDILRALTFPPFDNAHLEVDGETYYVDVEIRRADESDSETPEGLLTSY